MPGLSDEHEEIPHFTSPANMTSTTSTTTAAAAAKSATTMAKNNSKTHDNTTDTLQSTAVPYQEVNISSDKANIQNAPLWATTPYLQRRDHPPPEMLPGGAKSLSGISIRAFSLGASLGLNASLTLVLLLSYKSRLWRASLFLVALSLFHFLEYFLTALYNTPYAEVSAFLLTQNGVAYNVANLAALSECIITSAFFPAWQASVADARLVLLGLVLLVCGQTARSAAMAHAGTNFNHTVQTRKHAGHQLVTTGVYSIFRHPSYFGFFFWGIGTQIVVGNVVCCFAYTVILWTFFSRRIRKEEEYLVTFFGDDYVKYRSRTISGIPFVR